jgi:hypothetical protein
MPTGDIGQQAQARVDSNLVKLFHRGQLVKLRPRQPAGAAMASSLVPALKIFR